jgi:putative peptide zinc metalloprotease protein
MNAALEPKKDDVDGTGSLRLAPGVQLLGEYTDSGFSQPQYLLRRPDGQVILVSRLLYLVAAAIAEHDDLETVAQVVSESFGRRISPENVGYLISGKLRAAGVLDEANEAVSPTRADPLLGLRLRVGVVPQSVHRAATAVLQPLYRLPVVIVALVALALVDVWVITHRSSVTGVGVQVVSHPVLLLTLTLLTFTAMGFHELGHATACRYSGGTPGAMGVGVYLVFPAFYTDVTDAYRLDRRGRLRTDLGGIYFNLLFALGSAAGYFLTGFAPFLGLIVLSQVQAIYQLLPFVRLDGYYILGDLIGVPNLFAYVRAAAATLLPTAGARRVQAGRTMTNLTHRASLAVRAWVALTVPILLVNLGLVAYFAPRVVPAYWRSARTLTRGLEHAAAAGHWVSVANAGVQLLFLIIPALGWAVLGARGLKALTPPLARAASSAFVACRQALPLGLVASLVFMAAILAAAIWVGGSRHPATGIRSAYPPTAATRPGESLLPSESSLPAAKPVVPPPTETALPADVRGATATSSATGIGPTWAVQPGDDLWSIAQQVLNGALGRPTSEAETRSYWTALIGANPTLTDPDLLYAGQALVLPPTSELAGSPATQGAAPTQSAPPTQSAAADQPAPSNQQPAMNQSPSGPVQPRPSWLVHRGENLWSIAEQVLTGALGRPTSAAETGSYWTALIGANTTTVPNPDLLYAGQLLALPAA